MKKTQYARSMVEEKEVSVGWQMFFVLVPFVDIWAFYRIKKFWLGLITVLAVVFGFAYVAGFGERLLLWNISLEEEISLYIVDWIVAVFLIRKWSMSWNEKVTYQRRVF